VTLDELNLAGESQARAAFERCCGSRAWVEHMVASRPYADPDALYEQAAATARLLGESDWREAFSHHPRIGDVESLRQKFASTATWAESEQAGAGAAADDVLRAIQQGNRDYEARFGYIFVVCATGRSAREMLATLHGRLGNDPAAEIRIAAGEQMKITRLRLEKLLAENG
jgi:2-oxo-4-hydroxy-4-carboxy-5-ureidoimidazoline decarboxylase